jgi:hypothetical protein
MKVPCRKGEFLEVRMGPPRDTQNLTMMQACVSIPQSITDPSWGQLSNSCCKAGTMLKQVLLRG